LWDRLHVLTAAHCSPSTGASTNVTFATSTGSVTITGTATVNPGWTGKVIGGNDLSILTLETAAPVSGFQIDRDTRALTAPIPIVLAGYGLTGTGTGAQPGTGGTLRAGTNTYDVIFSSTKVGGIPGGDLRHVESSQNTNNEQPPIFSHQRPRQPDNALTTPHASVNLL
jgi:hypothetical protein